MQPDEFAQLAHRAATPPARALLIIALSKEASVERLRERLGMPYRIRTHVE